MALRLSDSTQPTIESEGSEAPLLALQRREEDRSSLSDEEFKAKIIDQQRQGRVLEVGPCISAIREAVKANKTLTGQELKGHLVGSAPIQLWPLPHSSSSFSDDNPSEPLISLHAVRIACLYANADRSDAAKKNIEKSGLVKKAELDNMGQLRKALDKAAELPGLPVACYWHRCVGVHGVLVDVMHKDDPVLMVRGDEEPLNDIKEPCVIKCWAELLDPDLNEKLKGYNLRNPPREQPGPSATPRDPRRNSIGNLGSKLKGVLKMSSKESKS